MTQLEQAIAMKKDEIRQREADLGCPEYLDKAWAQRRIDMCREGIGKIQAFLKDGGELELARCYHQLEVVCLIAHSGFNGGCRFVPRVWGVWYQWVGGR